jgi:tellurite methyltransferase
VTPISPSWDNRYSTKPTSTEPSEILVEFADILPRSGRALDLACGGGRNTVFLAQRNLQAVGIDRSREALAQGGELARQKKVHVEWIQADLETFALPPAAYDVIACTFYRDPKLYSAIRESLCPGGLLFYETFSLEQLRFKTGPRNPAHLLQPSELLHAFGDWDVLFYHETWIDRGVAALVARKPAA